MLRKKFSFIFLNLNTHLFFFIYIKDWHNIRKHYIRETWYLLVLCYWKEIQLSTYKIVYRKEFLRKLSFTVNAGDCLILSIDRTCSQLCVLRSTGNAETYSFLAYYTIFFEDLITGKVSLFTFRFGV